MALSTPALSAPGIGSNLDVNGIVSGLMAVERRPLAALDRQEAGLQSRISAYGSLKGALAGFQGAVRGLNDAGRLQALKASVTAPEILGAIASSDATPGSHGIEVLQLAQAQSLVAAGQASAAAAIGGGTLSFEFGSISDPGATFNAATGKYGAGTTFTADGNAAKTVTVAAGSTLEQIRDAINGARIGVTASIVNDGGASPYRLVLAADATGSARSVKIGVAGDAALASLIAHDPAGTQSLAEAASAKDALLKVNGIAVRDPDNTIEGRIPGLALTLLNAGATRVDVARDTASVRASVQSLVSAHNALARVLADLAGYDPAARKGGPLLGDAAARSMQWQLRSALTRPVAGSTGSLNSLSSIGVGFKADGTLALDGARLDAALADHFDEFAGLFATIGGTQGVASRVDGLIDSFLASDGSVAASTDRLRRGVAEIDKRRAAMNDRLDAAEKRYRAQFAALDALVGRMQSTSTFLSQQLDSLSNLRKQL